MKKGVLQKTIALAQRPGFILVATAGRLSKPHIVTAGKVGLGEGERADIIARSCSQRVVNFARRGLLAYISEKLLPSMMDRP
jgi:hypothetical protein